MARSKLLQVLLGELAPDLRQQLNILDHNEVGFASYRDRFTTLLEAISSHPENALLITEIYDKLFP